MVGNIQDNGNWENNMVLENILMVKLIKKVNGTMESDLNGQIEIIQKFNYLYLFEVCLNRWNKVSYFLFYLFL